MKRTLIAYPLVMLCLVYNFAGCTKDHEDFIDTTHLSYLDEPETYPVLVNIDSLLNLETIGPIPFPRSGSYSCNIARIYKDSVLYNDDKDKDVIVKVDKNPGAGKFFAWPLGLVIDQNTGSINVTRSQGGYKYTVGFVKTGTTDTCLQNIIISGATYKDSVFVLSANDTIAYPYFNANLYSAAICDDSGDDDYQGSGGNGNDKCEFDAEDNKGKKGNANEKHVKVRTISGAINLKKTLEEGAFGSTNPVNGQGILIPVYYKLNDKGGKALQKVNVQLIYYKSKTDIPPALAAYMQRKQTAAETGTLISAMGNPRPPLIVITRSF